MFAQLSITQRIQAGLILVIAFLLVLGSNRLDQKHFETVQNTVNSVYQDRVVVQDYIYQLNNIVHDIELQLPKTQKIAVDNNQNKKIEKLLGDFKATELTTKESNLLHELAQMFAVLLNVEEPRDDATAKKRLLLFRERLNEIQTKLDGLAEIQLNESGKLTQLSNKSLGINTLMSKLEIAFLILIGLLMLVLIFYPDKSAKAVKIE